MTTFINLFKNIRFVPRCIDCKYYLMENINNNENKYNTAKCMKNVIKCTDTGAHKYEYAYIARSENTMCGHNGANFEQKNA